MKQIYFDSAATTQVRKAVIDRMAQVLSDNYGNASSSHSFGRSSKTLVEMARKNIAKHLNVTSGEIVFTSGGTEADNLVLRSCVRDLSVKNIITSKIEHHAVLHTVEQLAKEHGVSIHFVDLNEKGGINYSHLKKLLESNNQCLVSLMHVNNEIGNLLDIQLVANLCRDNKALFHSDTVQSVGHFEMDLQEIPIDFLAVSAHKFHGPKGVGFAFIRKNSGIKPLIIGGEQERGLRAGTESIHNIIGLEESLLLAYKNLTKEHQYILGIKQHFIERLNKEFTNVKFNGYSGDLDKSTYTMINVCLPVDPNKSSTLLFQLDLKGIACSKGSACQSGSDQGSHVLSQILTDADMRKPSIRFSFSKYNTKKEVDYVVDILKEFINT
ncbi:MAG: cysteine desulfurase [Bacteroidia bacterium]|nr:cysteine desulfurase [Bacteroidia bacterium]